MWRYSTFNGVMLPIYNASFDLSPGKVQPPAITTINGSYDWMGDRRRLPGPRDIDVRGLAWNWKKNQAATADDIETVIEDIKAQVGQVGQLIRVDIDGLNPVQKLARLLSAEHVPQTTQKGIINYMDCIFWTTDPFFSDATLTTSPVIALVAGINSIPFLNPVVGKEDVINALLTFTNIATATKKISISYTRPASENIFGIPAKTAITLDVATATTIYLDCENNTISKTMPVGMNGAYNLFGMTSDHNESYWLRLKAGPNLPPNNLQITLDAGTCNFQISYRGQYP